MGANTGAQSGAVLRLNSVFGTAVAGSTGDRLEFESFDHSLNGEQLTANPLGSGDHMLNTAQLGKTAPTVSFETVLGYNNAALAAVVQQFGAESLTTIGGGWFGHSIFYNETYNQKYATVGVQMHSATAGVFEYPSCVTTRSQFTYDDPISYARLAIDMLANDEKITSTTNTYTGIEAATVADTTRVVFQNSDKFLINTQSGAALADGDLKSVRGVTIEYNRPQEILNEARGSSGNSSPIPGADIPFTATVTVRFANMDDSTWYTAYQAGTEYKARLVVTGSSSYRVIHHFPRLKVLEAPQHSIANAGNNELTVVFTAMVASSAPTGEISVYPYITLQNQRSTAY